MTSSKNKRKKKKSEEDDDDLEEISLSSKDPEDFTPQAPGSDFVGPDAYGDQPSDYLGWSESKNIGKTMRISRRQLRKILNEEARHLFEACGCGGGHPTYMHSEPTQDYGQDYGSVSMDVADPIGSLSREEALDLVSIIAARTACPVTQKALMGVVNDLSGEGVEDYDLTSDEAFGTGCSTGTAERDAFSYTGDVPGDPEDALGLGYQAGLMGLV